MKHREAVLVALALTLLPGLSGAASADLRVVYGIIVNGQAAPEEGRPVVETAGGVVRVSNEPAAGWRDGAPRETSYLDYGTGRTWQTALLKDGTRCTVETAFASLTPLTPTDETATILGRVCRKSTCEIRSNRIEVWHTEGDGGRGTPTTNLVAPQGLVLRIVRNGNYEIVAQSIEPATGEPVRLPAAWGDAVDLPAYRARVAGSWVTAVPVFEGETINFGQELAPPAADDPAAPRSPVYRHAGGTVILRRVRLPQDLDDATIIAELVQYSRGDAYDRTGSVFVVPAARDGDRTTFLDALHRGVAVLPTVAGRDGRTYQGIVATGDYQPPVELLRFITPFGVRHFNDQVTVRGIAWEDSAVYRADVTELAPLLRGDAWIGVFIGNYDQGGHAVSLTLRYHPNRREAGGGDAPRRFALPLFNTCNVLEMAGQEYGRIFAADSLTVDFEVPDGARDCVLRFITTGHGGWENGDEFVPKVNEILIDGRTAARLVPWRSDCGAYRRLNPASGNFWNGMSSSDFSRSGWCPGAAVSAVPVPLPGLTPGRHTVRVAIPLGEPEGDSFSAWNVSGVLVGERQAAGR
ncbi:MAG: peptide-N-glycosidase [bacterium]|nr:peptide-N-glycosidase [bacterium]